jgi:ABC-2 type transport system permease protein
MSTQSNALPESAFQSQVAAPADIPPLRLMYWSVRRELWENRFLYVAPVAVASVYLFAFFISTIVGIWEKPLRIDPLRQPGGIAEPYGFAAGLIMATAFIVGIFYCLDALHGERRDRSILFWKSLPVSDLMVVLSKASIPIVILPLFTFALTIATQLIMVLHTTLVMPASGLNVTALWQHLPLFQMWLMLFYHLVTVHALWHAPIYAWLLLVSGWARRVPFLWASLPPLAIGVLEWVAFRTSHFAAFVGYRLAGPESYDFTPRHGISMEAMNHLNLGRFLITPGLWGGLLVAALFLVAAARLRRDRGPI